VGADGLDECREGIPSRNDAVGHLSAVGNDSRRIGTFVDDRKAAVADGQARERIGVVACVLHQEATAQQVDGDAACLKVAGIVFRSGIQCEVGIASGIVRVNFELVDDRLIRDPNVVRCEVQRSRRIADAVGHGDAATSIRNHFDLFACV
jgi:hypothetical protein